MNWYKIIITTCILLCIATNSMAKYDDIEHVEYIDNYDGDTVTVTLVDYPAIIGNHIRVRLIGIDTPEMKGKCENEIHIAHDLKKYVHDELSTAKEIKITNVERDKYFRLLGDIIYDGKSLSKNVLSQPGVFEYHGDEKVDYWCK